MSAFTVHCYAKWSSPAVPRKAAGPLRYSDGSPVPPPAPDRIGRPGNPWSVVALVSFVVSITLLIVTLSS